MSVLANRITAALQQQHLQYELLSHAAGASLLQVVESLRLDMDTVVRAVVLHQQQHCVVAILPLGRLLDFHALSLATGRQYSLLPVAQAAELFEDCDTGVVPPFGNLYRLDVFCDAGIRQWQQVICEAGSGQALVSLAGRDFMALLDNAAFLNLSVSPRQLRVSASSDSVSPYSDLVPVSEDRVLSSPLHDLPDPPALFKQLQRCAGEDMADSQALNSLYTQNPVHASQLISLAESRRMSGEQAGSVDSVAAALSLLGPRVALALAQGLSVWDHPDLPVDGPLGRPALARQALWSARICYRLLGEHARLADYDPAFMLQAVMLQNVGYLVLSHQFGPEYFLLNRLLQTNPTVAVDRIEQQVLAFGHAREAFRRGHSVLGAAVLRHWGCVDGLSTICEHHHQPDYDGDYRQGVHLVQIANYLLAADCGDAGAGPQPTSAMKMLGLTDADLDHLRQFVQSECPKEPPAV